MTTPLKILFQFYFAISHHIYRYFVFSELYQLKLIHLICRDFFSTYCLTKIFEMYQKPYIIVCRSYISSAFVYAASPISLTAFHLSPLRHVHCFAGVMLPSLVFFFLFVILFSWEFIYAELFTVHYLIFFFFKFHKVFVVLSIRWAVWFQILPF